MSVAWKIRYHDGKVKTNEDGPFSVEDHFGVLVVSSLDKDLGAGLLHNEDYYLLHTDGTWTGHNSAGLTQMLVLNLDSIAEVCLGLYVNSKIHDAAISDAVADKDLTKTSWRKSERKERDF